MNMCAQCGQDKEVCQKCSQNYSDMFVSKDLSQVDKYIVINGEKFGLSRPSYIDGKIPEDKKLDWTVDKYNPDGRTRFVVAFLRWHAKDQWYDLESCGLRLCEYGSTELLKWIAVKAEELAEINRKDLEERYGWY